jgi:hypothetical protein
LFITKMKLTELMQSKAFLKIINCKVHKSSLRKAEKFGSDGPTGV